MNIFKIISEKYKNKSAKSELSAQAAYVFSVLNKPGEIEDVYTYFEQSVLTNIKHAAKFGEVELYISLPPYLMQEHKERLFKSLKEKGFEIVHQSYRSIIVNWEQL